MNEPSRPPKKILEKLTGLWLVNSTSFGGHADTLTVGRNVESIAPALMGFDGKPVAIDKGQRSDGFLVRQTKTNPESREQYTGQVFIAWANVREVQYGE